MKIIAILDRADGNAEIGTMWKETASFEYNEPISKVLEWANMSMGRDWKMNLKQMSVTELINIFTSEFLRRYSEKEARIEELETSVEAWKGLYRRYVEECCDDLD